MSIRGTELDAVVIGLVLKNNDKAQILSACFDGFYTYFASEVRASLDANHQTSVHVYIQGGPE